VLPLQQEEAEIAHIIVERTEGSLADRLAQYRVYIDGELRGTLANTETAVFDVEIGARSVKIGIDAYCSPPIKVAVLGRTRVTCWPNLAHALGMPAMLPPSAWITVQEEPDLAPHCLPPAQMATAQTKAA
jgi:hypothetical protein